MSSTKGILQAVVDNQGFCVLDGGLGSELARVGSLDPELWSGGAVLPIRTADKGLDLSQRTDSQIHTEYYRSGADVCTSASYQLSFPALSKRGYNDSEINQIFNLSSNLACEARDAWWASSRTDDHSTRSKPLVAASVGCYGAYLPGGVEFTGVYDIATDQLVEWHRQRFQILVNSNADVIACETLPNIDDIRALVRLCNECVIHKDIWLSMVCRDDHSLSSGESFEEATRVVLEEDTSIAISAIGVNCTAPWNVNTLLEILADMHTNRLLLAYPNRGEVWDATQRDWLQTGVDDVTFGMLARGWYERGARIIGGCCRTTPSTIAHIRHTLEEITR